MKAVNEFVRHNVLRVGLEQNKAGSLQRMHEDAAGSAMAIKNHRWLSALASQDVSGPVAVRGEDLAGARELDGMIQAYQDDLIEQAAVVISDYQVRRRPNADIRNS